MLTQAAACSEQSPLKHSLALALAQRNTTSAATLPLFVRFIQTYSHMNPVRPLTAIPP